jgi:hypothetical protein
MFGGVVVGIVGVEEEVQPPLLFQLLSESVFTLGNLIFLPFLWEPLPLSTVLSTSG